MTLTIYDKPLCCSSGVCGPNVDPALAAFADDLRWLAAQGVEVVRHNPAQNAHAFITDPLIREAMKGGGEAVLPVVAVDGVEKSRKTYPSRAELAAWTNILLDTNNDTACCGGTGCC